MWLCNSVDVVGRSRALVKSMFEKDLTEVGRKRTEKTTGEKEQGGGVQLKAIDKLFEE